MRTLFGLGVLGLIACGDEPKENEEEQVTNSDSTIELYSPVERGSFVAVDVVYVEGQVNDAEDATLDLTVQIYDGVTELCQVQVTTDGFMACDFEVYMGLSTLRGVVTDTENTTSTTTINLEVTDPSAPTVQILGLTSVSKPLYVGLMKKCGRKDLRLSVHYL